MRLCGCNFRRGDPYPEQTPLPGGDLKNEIEFDLLWLGRKCSM